MGRPSESHERVVDSLCDLRGAWRGRGWKLRIARALGDVVGVHQELVGVVRKIPDALAIHGRTVTLFEVVNRNDINPDDYVRLWFFLDCAEWSLELEVWSHHGTLTRRYLDEWFCRRWHDTTPTYYA